MFSKGRVIFDLKATTKEEVIDELIDQLVKDGKLKNREDFKKEVWKRENEFSTAIGLGIAIPHAKSISVREPSIVFGRSLIGIDYKAMNEELSKLFFLIAVPIASNNLHLKALSDISRNLMQEEVREKLFRVNTFQEFIEIFD